MENENEFDSIEFLSKSEMESIESLATKRDEIKKLLDFYKQATERPEVKVKAMLNLSVEAIYSMMNQPSSLTKEGDVNPRLKANILVAEKSAAIMKSINETNKAIGGDEEKEKPQAGKKYTPKIGKT